MADKVCSVCGQVRDALADYDVHDRCIANLPGVVAACCGHGGKGYIKFEDGRVLRGTFKVDAIPTYVDLVDGG